MFKFPQTHWPSMLFDAEKRNRLERMVNFVVSVCAPMFQSFHVKPRVSDKNAIFSRDLLFFSINKTNLGVRSHQKELLETCYSRFGLGPGFSGRFRAGFEP